MNVLVLGAIGHAYSLVHARVEGILQGVPVRKAMVERTHEIQRTRRGVVIARFDGYHVRDAWP